MEKIGILTYHCVPNFGAQLQTLSTIGYLQSHGISPVVLNWYPKDLQDYYYERVPKEQNQLQFEFAQREMPVTSMCRNIEELVTTIISSDLNEIFIGSDALFDYTPEADRYLFSYRKLKRIPLQITSNHLLPNPFWGSFQDYLPKPIPMVGYAISSQNMSSDKLNRAERQELQRLLGKFDNLTVRDKWTKEIVTDLSNLNNVKIVPDPVFAFNQNHPDIPSKEEIITKYNLPENYILISILHDILTDDFINSIVSKLEKEHGIDCVSFPMPDSLRSFKTKHSIPLPLSAIDWYALIKYSKGYIGERMHPIISCIHNSVPFFCFDQYGTYKTIIPRLWKKFIPHSSKIYDILYQAGLEDYSCFFRDIINLTPSKVVDKIINFPIEKCDNFASIQLHRYNRAMEEILK